MEQWYETLETRQCTGGYMQVGSLVRHKHDGDIGIVTWIGENRLTFIVADGRPWRTYRHRVEVICE